MSSNLMWQCLLGMSCNNFAMIAADQVSNTSVIIMKDDEDKLHKVSDKLVMGVNGDGGDTAQFAQYIAKNIQLYRMRNLYPLEMDSVVHFTRRNLADSLRSGTPYMVNLMFAGFDETMGGQIYYMDFLASCVKVPFAAHGLGGILSMSVMERYHTPTMTEQEAYQLLRTCVQEINQRLCIKLPNFQVSMVCQSGVKQMPIIKAGEFGR